MSLIFRHVFKNSKATGFANCRVWSTSKTKINWTVDKSTFSTTVVNPNAKNSQILPRYKLLYFDLRAIAEPIRLIFAYAKIPYEDKRISFGEWSGIKPTTPVGTMPVLFVDDKELTQSSTIARYLGRKFGLVPDDEFDAARCDEVVDMLHDIVYLWRPFRREMDSEKQAILKAKMMRNIVPKSLKRFEQFVTANENKHVAGSVTSWADLTLASYLEIFELTIDPNLLIDYPGLAQFKRYILSLPEIEGWIKSRPPFMIA